MLDALMQAFVGLITECIAKLVMPGLASFVVQVGENHARLQYKEGLLR